MLNAQTFVATALLIAYLFENELKSFLPSSKEKKEKVDWVIGILSSPGNFERRAIVRQTLLSFFDDLDGQVNVKPYFIIGKRSCDLPSSIRSDDYSCDEVKLAKSVKRPIFLVNKIVPSNPTRNSYVYRGFIFEVNHEITINRLGALSLALKNLSDFQLSLLDLNKGVSLR